MHTADDVAKLLLVGADIVMSTSALLTHGPDHLRTLEEGLRDWMAEHEYESLAQLRGSMSQRNVPNPTAYERANYMKELRSVTVPS